MYDMVIIGAGAAGLSAAIYARRAMLDTVVLEESPIVGGQILKTYDVDNYLGLPGLDGFTLAEHFRAHAEKLDTKFQTGTALKIEDLGASKAVTMADGSVLETRTVIYAAGAAHRKLGVPGEEALGGKGVSYCATCDGAFFRDKTVAVVGGGDVALEDAIFFGARLQTGVSDSPAGCAARGQNAAGRGTAAGKYHGFVGYGGRRNQRRRSRRSCQPKAGKNRCSPDTACGRYFYSCRYPAQHRPGRGTA